MSEADLRALFLDLERHCTLIDQATNSLSLHKHNEIANARHDDLIAPMSWDWLFDTVTPPSPHHPFTASLKDLFPRIRDSCPMQGLWSGFCYSQRIHEWDAVTAQDMFDFDTMVNTLKHTYSHMPPTILNEAWCMPRNWVQAIMRAFHLNSQIGLPPAYATSRNHVTAFPCEQPFGGILSIEALLRLPDKVTCLMQVQPWHDRHTIQQLLAATRRRDDLRIVFVCPHDHTCIPLLHDRLAIDIWEPLTACDVPFKPYHSFHAYRQHATLHPLRFFVVQSASLSRTSPIVLHDIIANIGPLAKRTGGRILP